MTKGKTQKDYDEKWIKQNREHKRYLSYRSTARTFIRNHAKLNDINNLKELIKNREELIMNSIINEIRKNYLVDGETERYATLFESRESVVEEMDDETFEEKFNESVDNVQYPIITFDNANAVDGVLFQSSDDEEYILDTAANYFDKK